MEYLGGCSGIITVVKKRNAGQHRRALVLLLQTSNRSAGFPKRITQNIYRVTWSEEGGEYVGLWAEFPSLSWLASSPEETLSGIRKGVGDVVADLQANHEPVPQPIATKKYSGRFMVRVPPELHRQLALKAAESGVRLNRLASDKLSRARP